MKFWCLRNRDGKCFKQGKGATKRVLIFTSDIHALYFRGRMPDGWQGQWKVSEYTGGEQTTIWSMEQSTTWERW